MSILDKIVRRKKAEMAARPAASVCVEGLRSAVARRGGVRDFCGALRRGGEGEVTLIAEVKKASPSAGVMREAFDPVGIAAAYESAGASCLSVLTDRHFFRGRLEDLKAIRGAVDLPLLRKDFIIDARQLLEAVEFGADAILLIVSILSDPELRSLHDLILGAGLSALVEVHNEEELDRALAVGATLVGVNNRDLRTFSVDLETTKRLAARLAATGSRRPVTLVAESGIRTRDDVVRVARSGARAILVGETLMRSGHRAGEKVRELLGTARGTASHSG